jgi:RimJ/RimL family protein N-acetyltransferase
VAVARDVVGLGYGAIAGLLFLDVLFASVPIDTVFAEVFGYQHRTVELIQKFAYSTGLQMQPIVVPRWYRSGTALWPKYMFALSREEWEHVRRYIFRGSFSSKGGD